SERARERARGREGGRRGKRGAGGGEEEEEERAEYTADIISTTVAEPYRTCFTAGGSKTSPVEPQLELQQPQDTVSLPLSPLPHATPDPFTLYRKYITCQLSFFERKKANFVYHTEEEILFPPEPYGNRPLANGKGKPSTPKIAAPKVQSLSAVAVCLVELSGGAYAHVVGDAVEEPVFGQMLEGIHGKSGEPHNLVLSDYYFPNDYKHAAKTFLPRNLALFPVAFGNTDDVLESMCWGYKPGACICKCSSMP
ncbi:hypothetical protein A6R68_02971, partial [Neotoma lepida]